MEKFSELKKASLYDEAAEEAEKIGKATETPMIKILNECKADFDIVRELREMKIEKFSPQDKEKYENAKKRLEKGAKELLNRCTKEQGIAIADYIDFRKIILGEKPRFIFKEGEEGRQGEETLLRRIEDNYKKLIAEGRSPEDAQEIIESDFRRVRESIRKLKGEKGGEESGEEAKKAELIESILKTKGSELAGAEGTIKIIQERRKRGEPHPFAGRTDITWIDLERYLKSKKQ